MFPVLGVPMGGGSILPFTIDFTALPDGALPAPLGGATWAVVSGAAVNTPSLSLDELLTDPGLEANYTDGKCDTLTKSGTPTLAQSADVHGGAKAQEYTSTAAGNRLSWPVLAGVAHTWYQFSAWRKKTTSGNDSYIQLIQSGGMPSATVASGILSVSYAQNKTSLLSTSTNNLTARPAYDSSTGPFATVRVDDGSLKAITSDPAVTFPATSADVIIKIKPPGAHADFVDDTVLGLRVRASSQSAPTNYIAAAMRRRETGSTQAYVSLFKRVGNTYTELITNTLVTLVSTAWLEVRTSGATVSLWYNNTQVGTDQTVSDVELLTNTYHTFFSTGGNKITGFFCGSELTAVSQQFAGTSFTASNPGYRGRVQDWQHINLPAYVLTYSLLALGGHGTWSNLVRLPDEAYDAVIMDTAGDGDGNHWYKSLEAFFRRHYAKNPNTRILMMQSPNWSGLDIDNDDTVHIPVNAPAQNSIGLLAAHYNIDVVPYWEWCKEVVDAGTYHLNQLTLDTIHPSTVGFQQMELMLRDYLPLGQKPPFIPLPARLYDCEDYEQTPARILGTAYDSRTGTGWSDNGTQVSSSTAGDTITYTATCTSIGIYQTVDTNSMNCEVSVDGGTYRSMYLRVFGEELIEGRGAHTITIRLKAGGSIFIDEFWAI
jgi:hypothetical protein